ncbi:MAG: hypothetical protein BGP04_23635 [Rhizobiales bacterium 62-17]|nr:acetolactate synthase [Hyphomicrobiales bacterium]OJY00544.1 MAG: hypothetical protein BGP04_23635 [Rhizobiales bacterium 62-17]
MNIAECVVEGLIEGGIATVYGLPGLQNDPFYDALFKARDRIGSLHVRHEQSAAYMALGAALATGKPQCCCLVPGPGFLNAATALATAYSTNAPVLCLVGQIPSHEIGKRRGTLHEIVDQSGILGTLTKWSARLERPQDAGALMGECFRQLRTGRPRPVGLEIPTDLWLKESRAPATPAASPRFAIAGEGDLSRAAQLLHAARAPMIVVGGGAMHVSDQVRILAEKLAAPVLSFRMGRGVIDSRHPLAVTPPVGHRLWPQVDVVIGIGTRLQTPMSVWGRDEALSVIRLEVDEDEMNRFGPPTIGLVGDAAETLPRLIAALERLEPIDRKPPAIQLLRDRIDADIAEKLPPQVAFLSVIREELGEDGILVDEFTQVAYVARFAYPVHQPRSYISNGYQGTLGWGYPTALGVAHAHPGRRVVSLSGDGGFLFGAQELSTAMHFDIPLVVVLFNDGQYGNVKRYQKENFDGRHIAVDLSNPDFIRFAESFGALALRAHSPQDLRLALQEAFKQRRPAVIEVPVGEFPSPFEFIQLPRNRGSRSP